MNYIKSVSLTKEHAEFVEKEHIKLSALLRKALEDTISYKNGELLENNASLMKKIERLTETIEKMGEFINKKGLYDDFLAEK